ncbi:MAG: PGPGW domain-containing protein [Nocardioidaceae bacterium]
MDLPAPGPTAGRDSTRARGRLHRGLHSNPVLALLTKAVVAVVGLAVLVAGVVMIVTPGPAFVLIPLGLAILATEFEWARHWLQVARRKAHEARVRAETMDPAVRRRRLLLTAGAVLVVAAVVVGCLAAFGWPSYAVNGWDEVQSRVGWAPELPGM